MLFPVFLELFSPKSFNQNSVFTVRKVDKEFGIPKIVVTEILGKDLTLGSFEIGRSLEKDCSL